MSRLFARIVLSHITIKYNQPRIFSSLVAINNSNLLQIHSTNKINHFKNYSKKTKNESKNVKKPKIQLSTNELNSHFEYDEMIENFHLAVDNLKDTYAKKLSLKLNQNTIESIQVKTTDGDYSIGELAQVVPKGASLIVIDLINAPQYLKQVQEAIAKSGMGINPQVDKTSLFVQIPKLTREHRESLSKNATQLYNEAVAKLQNSFNKNTKKVSNLEGISEDTITAIKEQIKYQFDIFKSEAMKVRDQKTKELLDSK